MKKVCLQTLSFQQIVTLLTMWQDTAMKRENASFTEMVDRCYQSTPWHANAPIIYQHKPDGKGSREPITCVEHAMNDLTEHEEDVLMDILRCKLLIP